MPNPRTKPHLVALQGQLYVFDNAAYPPHVSPRPREFGRRVNSFNPRLGRWGARSSPIPNAPFNVNVVVGSGSMLCLLGDKGLATFMIGGSGWQMLPQYPLLLSQNERRP